MRKAPRLESTAFSLLEMLVATTVFAVVLVVVFSGINQASNVWRSSGEKIEAFQDARAAFEIMTRNLSQATLNPYLDYDNPANPTSYQRHSDLQFTSGNSGVSPFPGTPGTGQAVFFQVPAGYTKAASSYGSLECLLNSCGYYVTFDSDAAYRPSLGGASTSGSGSTSLRYRFRLMQLLVPTENNTVYSGGTGWFSNYLSEARPLADNVIALIIRPQDPALTGTEAQLIASQLHVSMPTPPDLTADYQYNSAVSYSGAQPIVSNQLPPVIQVTMVAISESLAHRLESGTNVPSVITAALAGKFENPANYQTDLQRLQTDLAKSRIVCRIFSSSVPVRESRWTK